jgi:hypothetical protein
MRICCSLRLWGVVVLAQWLNQHPVNGALVVDLRWQPDYMWYDPRERRGFVPWERTGCPHSPVKTPTAAPVQKAERRKSLLSCLTQGGSSRCEAEGRHPIECAQASSVRAGISSVRHNYFSDPPPREELRRHYRQLRDSTATWRGVHVHAYGSHDGWVVRCHSRGELPAPWREIRVSPSLTPYLTHFPPQAVAREPLLAALLQQRV